MAYRRSFRLGDTIPNFSAETTKGKIQFYDWQNDMWVILLSHPKDFTPVCTSELTKIAFWEPYFSKRNTKFLAHSCDSLKEHLAWVKDIVHYCEYLPTDDLSFPIMADKDGQLATLLDLFDANSDNNDVVRTSRPLYIIDPTHKLRFSIHYPITTGRCLKEVLRVLESLQLCDQIPQIETPVNWKHGEKVLIKSSIGEGEIRKHFRTGIKTEYISPRGTIRSLDDYQ